MVVAALGGVVMVVALAVLERDDPGLLEEIDG